MNDKLKDYLDQFHDKGVFLPTKTIMLTGAVDEDMYSSAMANLHALDSMSGDITIKLYSEGGDLVAGRAIYDAIANLKNRVNIIVYGEACSAATIILQAADYRAMVDNSKMMIHIGCESVPSEHPRNVDRVYNEHRKDEKWIEDIYLKRIKEKKKRFTRQQLKDVLVWDKYLSPKEALEMGLIDGIGEIQ